MSDLDDYRWLTSSDASAALAIASRESATTVQLAQKLRRLISPQRTHLVMSQLDLRKRAESKFSRAAGMFFQRALLEQASDEVIAKYKATRFPAERAIVDLCCGLGGDLLALAARGECLAIDRDPIATTLARANLDAYGLEAAGIRTCDVRDWRPGSQPFWHIDPDRRALGKRTTRPDLLEPDIDTIEKIRKIAAGGAIKLAPATEVPAPWQNCSREWIASRGECRQQVVWCGDCVSHPSPLMVTATMVGHDVHSFRGTANLELPCQAHPGHFVYELDASLLAARLEGAVADKFGLSQFVSSSAYLTCDHQVSNPMLTAFQVVEVLPFSLKKVRSYLRQKGIGRVEIKHRGLRIDPRQLRSQLKCEGNLAASLLVLRSPLTTLAIVAQRLTIRPSADDIAGS